MLQSLSETVNEGKRAAVFCDKDAPHNYFLLPQLFMRLNYIKRSRNIQRTFTYRFHLEIIKTKMCTALEILPRIEQRAVRRTFMNVLDCVETSSNPFIALVEIFLASPDGMGHSDR